LSTSCVASATLAALNPRLAAYFASDTPVGRR
jgi:hypothetical protein